MLRILAAGVDLLATPPEVGRAGSETRVHSWIPTRHSPKCVSISFPALNPSPLEAPEWSLLLLSAHSGLETRRFCASPLPYPSTPQGTSTSLVGPHTPAWK